MSPRQAQLAKLHLARKQLALTEESYRDVLRRVTGQESAAALDEKGLDRALAEFRRLGFKPKPARTGTAAAPQIRMIYAVWGDICALGGLTRASGDAAGHDAEDERAALRAFVARQTKTMANPQGVSDPRFLDSAQANRVLEGLKAWRRRLKGDGGGVMAWVWQDARLRRLARELRGAPMDALLSLEFDPANYYPEGRTRPQPATGHVNAAALAELEAHDLAHVASVARPGTGIDWRDRRWVLSPDGWRLRVVLADA